MTHEERNRLLCDNMRAVYKAVRRHPRLVRRVGGYEEAVQIACTALLEYLPRYESEKAALTTFIFRWVYYALSNEIRRRKLPLFLDTMESLFQPKCDRNLMLVDLREEVEIMLNSLPQRHWKDAVSQYYKGVSIASIARQYGCGRENARLLVANAIAKLRAMAVTSSGRD